MSSKNVPLYVPPLTGKQRAELIAAVKEYTYADQSILYDAIFLAGWNAYRNAAPPAAPAARVTACSNCDSPAECAAEATCLRPPTARDGGDDALTTRLGHVAGCLRNAPPVFLYPMMTDIYNNAAALMTEAASAIAAAHQRETALRDALRKAAIKDAECSVCGASWLFPFADNYPEEHRPGCLAALPQTTQQEE